MTPERLIGRVKALEWLLTTIMADGISRSPIPASAAAEFQALTVGQCGSLLELAKVQGDTPEGHLTAAFADAVVTIGANVVNAAAAGMADRTGPAN